jgi:hypothetical protein
MKTYMHFCACVAKYSPERKILDESFGEGKKKHIFYNNTFSPLDLRYSKSLSL